MSLTRSAARVKIRIMFRTTLMLALLSGASLVSAADANPDGRYSLSAVTVVHAESSVGVFDQTLYPTLTAAVTHTAQGVSLELRRESYVCTLQGTLSNHSVLLQQGQTCPQSIRGEGFQATLEGTLTSGSAVFAASELKLSMKWDVHGTVKVGPLPIAVTGTISTTASGPKT